MSAVRACEGAKLISSATAIEEVSAPALKAWWRWALTAQSPPDCDREESKSEMGHQLPAFHQPLVVRPKQRHAVQQRFRFRLSCSGTGYRHLTGHWPLVGVSAEVLHISTTRFMLEL